jgi:stage V sporulation protein B
MTEIEMRKSREERSRGFASGVIVLTLSAVIVKIIGLVYKIPMLTLLGSEGMGYFNSAYEIYMLFGVVSTAGLPVAMSVMISGARERGELSEKTIFSVALTLFLLLGVIGTALMLGIAPLSERIFGSDGVILCIIAISPTVFFICLSSVYRGFFQGLGKMRETAISQVIEAALKLVLGLIFAYIAIRCGSAVPEIAAFAVLGLTLSSAVSAIYLMLTKRAQDKGERSVCGGEGGLCASQAESSRAPRRKILSSLLLTAIPISLSALVMNLTKIIDMTVILRRMQDIGYTSAESFSAYGSYTTLALPLFSLAPTLISSVALPLVPTLAGYVAVGDERGQVEAVSGAVKLTMIVSMPISLGLSLFSREILTLIFGGEPDAVALATPLLSILAISIPLACLITVENAVLQAYSAASLPMISMAAGSLVKIILAYFLIGNRAIGIAGAPISTFACDIVINAINWYFIGKRLPGFVAQGGKFAAQGGKNTAQGGKIAARGGKIAAQGGKNTAREVSIGIIARPFFAAFISVGAARLAYSLIAARIGESSLATLATIALCTVIYLPISLFIGAIGRDEVKAILRRERN